MGNERKNWGSSFAGLIKKAPNNMDGINIEDLGRDDVLVVQTRHNTYTAKILDPQARKVLISGPMEYLPEPREACLQGSFAGDSSLSGGWIIAGMRLYFAAPNWYLLPSEIQRVYLNGSLLL